MARGQMTTARWAAPVSSGRQAVSQPLCNSSSPDRRDQHAASPAASISDEDALSRRLATLDTLSRDELARRWTRAYGRPPPPSVRRELLAYAAAWHLQAKQMSGLGAEAKALLRRAVARVERQAAARQEHASALLDGEVRRDPGAAIKGGENAAADTRAMADASPAPAPERPRAGGRPAGDAGGGALRAESLAERRILSAGARLLRDWQGRTHVVDVVAGGFLYEGRRHRSLSAIARAITGAHWSGPRFFGL